MAEVILREKIRNRFSIENLNKFSIDSAGIMADGESLISDNARKLLNRFYRKMFDENRKCKKFDESMLKNYDIILTVTENHKQFILDNFGRDINNVFTLCEFVGEEGNIEDPFMCDIKVYEDIFNRLDFLLNKLLYKLEKLGG